MKSNSIRKNEVAFVIPAFNEEAGIESTLRSIFDLSGRFSPSCIYVVDNNSTDETARIARSAGANVITQSSGTIGKVRNRGVLGTTADVLVFLDADVTLTSQWHEEFPNILESLRINPTILTGSHCCVPDDNQFFQKYWFSAITDSTGPYLGSGHLIMTRSMFDKVGGFSEQLETGEDYDLCQRALALDGIIVKNQSLKVYHHDFPNSIKKFIAREAWHGLGDLESARTALSSKVFLAASLLFLSLSLLTVTIAAKNWTYATIVVLGIFSYLILLSIIKFRESPVKTIVVNSGILFIYLIGRLFSLPLKIKRIIATRPH